MRKKAIVLSIAAVVAVLAYAFLAAPRQPSYGGRSLSTWLDIYFPASGNSSLQRQAAEQAIREMGQESLPWLVRGLKAKNGRWGKAFAQAIYPMLLPLGASHFWRPAADQNSKVIPAFRVLGKTADPAIPELLGVVTNATDRTQGMPALEALYAISSERAFDAVMSLKGTQPSFTEQRLRNNFVAHNPSMAEYARRRTESPDEKR